MTDLAHVAALEASGRAALPALREERVGDWTLRVSGGETKRVNSASPLVANATVLPAIAAAERLYASHGLPCRFRLTPLADSDADAMLDARGFAAVDHSLTMAAPVSSHPVEPAVRLAARADTAWLARVEPLSGRSAAAAAVQAKLLAAVPGPLAMAAIDEGGQTVASGYASIGGGRAQLSDIVVAPHARGRGLGRRLVAELLGWADGQGCGEAMLQVLATNTVARSLYRSLGFVDVYPYHYRTRR